MLKKQDVYQYDDEIELLDILRIILKWKKSIITGIILITLASIVFTLFLPGIYKTSMLILPGIRAIDEEGKKIYSDTPERIKAKIEAGIYDEKILAKLKKEGSKEFVDKVEFGFETYKNFDGIKIFLESSDKKKGLEFLNLLKEELVKDDKRKNEFFVEELNKKIFNKKIDLDNNQGILESYKKNIANFDKRKEELLSDIKKIADNTRDLQDELHKIIKNNPKENSKLSFLIYTNTIQQNLQIENRIKNALNSLIIKRENQIKTNLEQTNKIKRLKKAIDDLLDKKKMIKPLQLIESPHTVEKPVKPNKPLIVLSSFFISIMFMLMLVFVLEYIKNNRFELNE